MTLVRHQRMVRGSDGMKGEVLRDQDSGKLRIFYKDRDQFRWAPMAEENDWVPAALPVMALRDEEKRLVAQAADAKLRALMNHEPDRFWEAPSEVPFDEGLVQAVMEYLSR